ncbi:class I SAM-dependent methyltransferase [Roseovarius mucosus]|uniref:class I SAM-dependent methyltransferase n=1 Tax=Roseovarius mucosus TaxID=215743 RepID=UPI003BA903CF
MQSHPADQDANESLRLSEQAYDTAIFHPRFRQFYGESDLYNFGFWHDSDGQRIDHPGEAARELVRRHIAQDPNRARARRVLDVGCGLGACTAQIASAYPQADVIGINYSSAQIDHASRLYAGPRISFQRMRAESIAFQDDTFDCIHAIETAMHFRTRQQFLEEARRLLRPGGRLILTDVLVDKPTSFVPHENVLPTVRAYRAALEAAGLMPVTVEDIHADTTLPFVRMLKRNAMAAYARGLERSIKGYVIAVAEKPDES